MVGSQRPHVRAMTRAVPTRDSGRANGSCVLCRARRGIKATPEGLLHGARGASVMARGARHQARHQARGVGGSGRHARHGTRGAFLHRVQDRRRRDRVGMILFYFAPRPGSPPATSPGIAAGDTSRKAAEKVQEAARYLRSRARTYITHAPALQKISKFFPRRGIFPQKCLSLVFARRGVLCFLRREGKATGKAAEPPDTKHLDNRIKGPRKVARRPSAAKVPPRLCGWSVTIRSCDDRTARQGVW